MRKVTVIRSRWLNGSNCGDNKKTYLYHPRSRHMDVLGYYLNSLGVRKGDLYCKSSLEDAVQIARDCGSAWVGTVKKPSPILQTIAKVNDNPDISNAAREVVLVDAFTTIGVELEFVD